MEVVLPLTRQRPHENLLCARSDVVALSAAYRLARVLSQGHEACVRTLLLTGADKNGRRGLDGATPLHQVGTAKRVAGEARTVVAGPLQEGRPSALRFVTCDPCLLQVWALVARSCYVTLFFCVPVGIM